MTAAYNPGPALRFPAAALQAQTFRGFEWIIVDDASAPEHQRHFEAAAAGAQAPVDIIRQTPNQGQAAARNRGLAAARAPFVKFLDADDEMDPEHLENLLRAARSASEKDLVFAPTRHVYSDSRRREWVNTAYQRAGATPLDQLGVLLVTPFLHHCGVLFRRDLLLALGGYDESLRTDEDGDLLIRILLSGSSFSPCPGSNYIYRHDPDLARVSRDDTDEKLEARIRVCEKLVEHFRSAGQPMPEVVRHGVASRLDAIAMSAWPSSRALARHALALAAAIEPRYARSGPRLARVLRRAVGIGPALRLMAAARVIRSRIG